MKRATGTAAQGIGDPYVPHSGNTGFTVSHYDLDLDYRVSTNALGGTATLTATVTGDDLSAFTLDLIGLKATKVTVDGKRGSHSQQRGKLTITPAAPLAAGAGFTVSVQYSGSPSPTKGWWGDIGWEELTDGVLVASQPNGAGTWFPCNDHPSDKASYSIAVTAPSAYTVVAPGTLAAKQVKASRTRWTYRESEPMATYLVTLQLGLYEAFDLIGGSVAQKAYVPRSLRRAFDSDFGDQHAMIDLFERLFGPYPFERYSVVVTDDDLEIPLEAQGMSIFGRNHVTGQGLEERLIAHELAHQWFGNSLTVDSWRHIWLHEGFACYAEWLWSEGSGGPSADTLARQHRTRLAALPQDIVVSDPGPDAMFDDRVYKRGALTLHALRLLMGDEKFFDCLRTWTAENRFGSINTDGFVEIASRFGGDAVVPLLKRWLFATQLPAIAPA